MTAAVAMNSRPKLFSTFCGRQPDLYRTRPQALAASLLGQALIVAVFVYFSSCVLQNSPGAVLRIFKADDQHLVFFGHGGGGGGSFDRLPASRGNLPRASLSGQITSPTVIVPKEMPKLAVEPTLMVAPEVKIPQGGQVGDPLSQFTQALSNGPGGPGGIGHGCCDGVGDGTGPHFGSGPPGIYPAGKMGVSAPQVIYNPEPSFSDEARKSKTQGVVVLMLVVGKDGRTYSIHVRQSLGMGLDEKAIEAVSHWLFRPATLNGQPVATQIAVEVEFRLY